MLIVKIVIFTSGKQISWPIWKAIFSQKIHSSEQLRRLSEELNIPDRSLDKVLKALKADRKIFFMYKSGRGGGID